MYNTFKIVVMILFLPPAMAYSQEVTYIAMITLISGHPTIGHVGGSQTAFDVKDNITDYHDITSNVSAVLISHDKGISRSSLTPY
jgi:hypothetical protein